MVHQVSTFDLIHQRISLRGITVNTKYFTLLPIGLKIENGEIQVCPYCNRRGKLEVVGGKRWYIHSETVSAEATSPAVQCDMCPSKESAAAPFDPESSGQGCGF